MGEYIKTLAEMDTIIDGILTVIDTCAAQLVAKRAAVANNEADNDSDGNYTVVVTRSKRAPRASKWTSAEWRDSYWEDSYFAPSLEKRRSRRASGKRVALVKARGKEVREMKRAQLRDIDAWVTEEVWK